MLEVGESGMAGLIAWSSLRGESVQERNGRRGKAKAGEGRRGRGEGRRTREGRRYRRVEGRRMREGRCKRRVEGRHKREDVCEKEWMAGGFAGLVIAGWGGKSG